MQQLPQTSDNLNLALSQRAAKTVTAVPHACWQNAAAALLVLPELASGQYVEGWAVLVAVPIPVEHAWIELAGQLVDPTPISWQGQFAYFPGLRFTKAEVAHAVHAGIQLPLAWQYGWGGMKHPAYVQAYKQAWSFGLPRERLEKFLKEK